MVAIKDIEMPSCCAECNFTSCKGKDEPWNYCCAIDLQDVDLTTQKRPINCPLTEIEKSDDCVSRADVFQMIKDMQGAGDYSIGYYTYDRVKNLPPVRPARKVPREDITEDEVRINMLELALNQAKEHAESIEVLTDNHRLIFKAEKRGNRNENISRPYAK